MTEASYNVMTMPIAYLPAGFFWTRVEMIGLTDDEARAMMRGEKLPEKRQAELTQHITRARIDLISAEAGLSRS